MSIRIIVRTDNVHVKSGTAQKTGKAYTIRTQDAAIDAGADFPKPIRLALDADQPAYPPGEYTLTPDSFEAGEYGDIRVSKYPKLLSLSGNKQPAQAVK